jgi:AraC-like DNA-binding protein
MAGEPLIRILWHGSTEIGPTWRHRLHDPFWRLYLNDQEGAWITDGAQVIPLLPGRVHLVPAWSGMDSRCRGRVRHRWIHADLGDWGRGAVPIAVRLADPDRLRRLCDAEAWDPAQGMRALALVHECLAEALAGGAIRLGESLPDPVARACRLLEDGLHRRISAAALATAAGLSPGHLRARFAAVLGCSPSAWQRERRVALAGRLLLATERSLDDIAAACGFANRFHLSRVFARMTGLGPATWRRRTRAASSRPST